MEGGGGEGGVVVSFIVGYLLMITGVVISLVGRQVGMNGNRNPGHVGRG